MELGRRIALAACLAATAQPVALAQPAYPTHSVTVIVGFSAGGSVDVMARNLLAVISTQLGQQFVVVNKEGASGSIAFAGLALAKPDGYTIGAGPTTPMSIAPHIHKDVRYGPESFEYICQSFENVFTVAVPAGSPFRSIGEIVAAARARPGKLTYAHSRVGRVPHLSLANSVYRTGIDVVAVPYRGEIPAVQDLLGARVDFGSPSVALAVGRNLRVLAVFADQRHAAFPEAPTFSELDMPSMPPGFNGLFAPKDTPRQIIAMLERACEEATRSEAFQTAAKRLYQPVVYLNGAAFAERARKDYQYKGELIKALGIRGD